ncbi:MAG: hypothetical protein U0M04_02465 [Christensenellales bacterium]|nr:hypothetical protein [Christensenellales bacterium]
MTENYVQKVEIPLRKGARRDQILGIVFQLMGLGLIPVAIFFDYLVFIAVAVPIALGIWLTQRFYSTAREFEYAFTGKRLVISRTNIVGRGRRMLEIAFSDVKSFTRFYDIAIQGDFVAAEDLHSPDVKALVFAAGDGEYRLLFTPDDYMTALISDRLRASDGEKQ